VDGPLTPLPCTNLTAPVKCADCPSLEHCWLRTVMADVGEALNAALDQITLAEICRRAAQSQRSRSMQALMYEI
jgi:DNA-binding IscR family transcriptional regulator